MILITRSHFINKCNALSALQIPPAFLKHLRVGESGAAIVKDPAGRCWDIKLLRMGDHIIFEEGWMKFVEENGLDTSDFLVFRYDGELHFTVTILNKGCVEKSPATPRVDVIADEDHLQSVDMDMEEKCTTPTADVVAGLDHLESVDVDMEENCTRTKAWDAACSLKTSNPTFKKMVAESDSYRMRIPADASNESVPKKTCQVNLEDPDGTISTEASMGGRSVAIATSKNAGCWATKALRAAFGLMLEFKAVKVIRSSPPSLGKLILRLAKSQWITPNVSSHWIPKTINSADRQDKHVHLEWCLIHHNLYIAPCKRV
ncbi:B3 domain-containing protein [Nymphaea thermarum]|nr:B3 domain-containing protein [Nymphaea thermarum]